MRIERAGQGRGAAGDRTLAAMAVVVLGDRTRSTSGISSAGPATLMRSVAALEPPPSRRPDRPPHRQMVVVDLAAASSTASADAPMSRSHPAGTLLDAPAG